MLFRKKDETKSQLQIAQNEREAIVDLLHLCLYADSHVALTEGEFVSDVVNVIGWDTKHSFGSYEARSISGARAAKENAGARKEFILFAAERLHSKEARALAIDLCAQLFSSDGVTGDSESALLREIRAGLDF